MVRYNDYMGALKEERIFRKAEKKQFIDPMVKEASGGSY